MSPVREKRKPEGESERRCMSCGYSLTGLEPGATCPECGFEITDSVHFDVSLDHAAPAVVYGVTWRMIAAVAMLVLIAPLVYLVLAFAQPAIAITVTAGSVIPIVTWFFTTGWSDSSAIFNDLGERDLVRRLARWGAAAWVLYGVATSLEVMSNSGNPQLTLIGSLAFSAGVIQLTLLGIVLERLARWTRDEFAQALARFVTFAMVVIFIGSIAGVLVQFLYRPSASLVEAVSGLVMLAVTLGFLVLSVRLSSNGVMAIIHLYHNRSVDRRRNQRQAEYEEEIAARSAGINAHDDPERQS